MDQRASSLQQRLQARRDMFFNKEQQQQQQQQQQQATTGGYTPGRIGKKTSNRVDAFSSRICSERALEKTFTPSEGFAGFCDYLIRISSLEPSMKWCLERDPSSKCKLTAAL